MTEVARADAGEGQPVLELDGARPAPEAVWGDADAEAGLPAINLRLGAGELVVLEAPNRRVGRAFAALCAGLPRLAEGRARLLGQDWSALPRLQAEALRGRIGHVFAEEGGWLPHLSVEEGILLPQLHHSRTPEAALRDRATALAREFGLAELPSARPAELTALDIARAACVRTFLGEPALVLVESPLRQEVLGEELTKPLLRALDDARARGAACLWLTRSSPLMRDPALPTAGRLRFSERGLSPAGGGS